MVWTAVGYEYKLRPLLFPQGLPTGTIYHVFQWSNSSSIWKYSTSGTEPQTMEGGQECIDFYDKERDFDLVAETSGMDLTPEASIPLTIPNPRVNPERGGD